MSSHKGRRDASRRETYIGTALVKCYTFERKLPPSVPCGEAQPTASTPINSRAPGMPGTQRRVTDGSDEGLRNEKKMLINVADEEESRVAIMEDGILEELTIGNL